MSTQRDMFLRRVGDALEPFGWRPTGDQSDDALSFEGRFFRSLAEGWSAVLEVRYFITREEMEVPRWRRGMRAVLEVSGGVTFPAAERLAAQLRVGTWNFGIDAEPEFVVAGEPVEDVQLLQIRGSEDHDWVSGLVVDYAVGIVEPWARGHATPEAWIAAMGELADEEPDLMAWDVPVLLAACGRGDEAQRLVAAAAADPAWAGDAKIAEFVADLDAFLSEGEAALRGRPTRRDTEPAPHGRTIDGADPG